MCYVRHKDPKIEPYGTPIHTSNNFEIVFLNITSCLLVK